MRMEIWCTTTLKAEIDGLELVQLCFRMEKNVFVRHGGVFVRMSPHRLQKATAGCTQVEEKITDTGTTVTNIDDSTSRKNK